MDKIEKIRKELERRIEAGTKAYSVAPSSAIGGILQAYENILSFINSLPEEPVSEDRKEAILKKAHELAKEVDLIKDYFPKTAIIAAACDMAEWCDAHPVKEPVSEELEEAIDDAMPECMWGVDVDDDGVVEDGYDTEQMREMFKAGAQWQLRQVEHIIEENVRQVKGVIHDNAVKYGKRQIINAACDYLIEHSLLAKPIIDDFRKTLGED